MGCYQGVMFVRYLVNYIAYKGYLPGRLVIYHAYKFDMSYLHLGRKRNRRRTFKDMTGRPYQALDSQDRKSHPGKC